MTSNNSNGPGVSDEKKTSNLPKWLKTVIGCSCVVSIIGAFSLTYLIGGVNVFGYKKMVVSYNNNGDNSWDNKPITAKYTQVTFNDITYSIWDNEYPREILKQEVKSVPIKYIGDQIGTSKMTSYRYIFGEHIPEEVITDVKVFSINNIDISCALAVEFIDDNPNEYYAYINRKKVFNSIGEFVEQTNLKQDYSFTYTLYKTFKNDTENKLIKFNDFGDDYIYKNIITEDVFENKIVEHISLNKDSSNRKIMDLCFDCEKLGIIGGVGIFFYKNGYISLYSYFSSHNIFYLGEKTINNFKNFLIKNVRGYEITYDNSKSM